ncbi:MAG: hypothetical protein ABEJ43_00575 [Haloferacaceae archaeon]
MRRNAKGERDGETFEDALADLKRRGSTTLVVGSVPAEAYHEVSRRMLGDQTSDGERRRLLVVPDSDREAAAERLRGAGPTDAAHARIVTCNGTSRSAAASGGPNAGVPAIRRVDGSISDLGVAITESVERFEAVAGGLEPAELRVGVDPLSALDGYDTRSAFGFLHVLGRQVRAADGMAHVRLAREYDTPEVRTLAPLFDAVLELRLDGYRLEQRWHLADGDVVSDWLPVDEYSGER